jgi:hypothetical protein
MDWECDQKRFAVQTRVRSEISPYGLEYAAFSDSVLRFSGNLGVSGTYIII